MGNLAIYTIELSIKSHDLLGIRVDDALVLILSKEHSQREKLTYALIGSLFKHSVICVKFSL